MFRLRLSKKALKIAYKIEQQSTPAVAIHYRDYTNIKAGSEIAANYIGILDIDYYTQAIKIINRKYSNAKFYVFSDTISTAKKVLQGMENLKFIEYTYDNNWEDMKLMSLCDHNIIANSTYSYWAAYLNTNENKIVIAPQQLFLMQQDNNDNIYPNDWIKITSHFQ